jgi:alpha/beta superfamily hydrolase
VLIGGPSFLPSYHGQRGIQRKNQKLDRHFTLFAPAPCPTEVGSKGARGGCTKAERLFIPGPEGKLEALLEFEPRARVRAVAIVCHPHPLYGGTMHNKVVHRAAKAALQAGLPVLRFNFRGVTNPKLIVQGTEDIFGTRGQVEELFASLAQPKRLHWVEGADHFFTGKLNAVQTAVRCFLQEVAAPPRAE